jgi:flagellar biosynthesis component FlhA
LARTIVEPFVNAGKLRAVTLDPALERQLLEAVGNGLGTGGLGTGGLGSGGASGGSRGEFSALPPGFLSQFVDRTAHELARMAQGGGDPVLLTRAPLRQFLSEVVGGAIPHAAVLSYQEAMPVAEVETVGQVRLP